MTVAESLECSVQVAASRVSSLEDSNGQQAPQTTHRVDRNNTSCVFQFQFVLCKAAEVVQDH